MIFEWRASAERNTFYFQILGISVLTKLALTTLILLCHMEDFDSTDYPLG